MQKKAVLYDKGGDKHYDYISAWIKATRGSDPDASLYYLAVMLEGGEDPRFIARRMIVLASEDIGNADPQALQVAVAAAHAVEHVGMPECALNLSQAAVYLRSHRSPTRARAALSRARARRARATAPQLPPPYLQDAHYPGAAQAGARDRLRVSARPARGRLGPTPPARSPCRTAPTTSRPTVASRRSSRKRIAAVRQKQRKNERIATTLIQPMRSIWQQAGIGHAFVCP